MIDVGAKRKTKRIARAQAFIKLNKEIIRRIRDNDIPKGNALENARIAGIMAAKKTASLIPLCHNIELEYAGIDFSIKDDGVVIESLIKSTGKTGVEMEAMVSCSVAALTVYDMCKMFAKDLEITNVFLLEKRGGKSGAYMRGNR
ncbi:MAG: cyclic pyranopterin monophosphate synthase MoaC [Candidatus Omnitrophota bacterium]